LELAGPISLTVRLARTNRGILARGRVSAPLRRICARCLDAYVEEVSVPIEDEFLPSVDPVSGAAVALSDEPEAQRIDQHNELDLGPIVRDELSLTEPMHPLCSPDCPGLCAVCGVRLSSGQHDHEDDEIDPRLAPLARLMERRGQE
jgi:uncharacterized protein